MWEKVAHGLRSGLGGRHEGGGPVEAECSPGTGAECSAPKGNGRVGAQRDAREKGAHPVRRAPGARRGMRVEGARAVERAGEAARGARGERALGLG